MSQSRVPRHGAGKNSAGQSSQNSQNSVGHRGKPRNANDDRRGFVGGSDAKIIMGADESALLQLWKQKRGEADPPDLSDNLAVQLGRVTEGLNRRWFEQMTGASVVAVQERKHHPVHKWMGATLDGVVQSNGAVFEAKFMLPWAFSEEAAAQKHMAQLQHNMWVTHAATAELSIVTGGAKYVRITIPADALYQHLLLVAEKKFWRCVQNGEPPRLFGVEAPPPRIEAVRVADMTSSNSWAQWARAFDLTFEAHAEHETARAELKRLMPEDAREARGHGLRAKRSKSGAVSFERIRT